MDVWSMLEKNLAALKTAGIQAVGKELPRLKTGGAPKKEQVLEYRKAELRRRWALSWKWK